MPTLTATFRPVPARMSGTALEHPGHGALVGAPDGEHDAELRRTQRLGLAGRPRAARRGRGTAWPSPATRTGPTGCRTRSPQGSRRSWPTGCPRPRLRARTRPGGPRGPARPAPAPTRGQAGQAGQLGGRELPALVEQRVGSGGKHISGVHAVTLSTTGKSSLVSRKPTCGGRPVPPSRRGADLRRWVANSRPPPRPPGSSLHLVGLEPHHVQ